MQRSHSVGSMNETDSERQTMAGNHEAKPLPPLPRGCSRLFHETGLLLRSIGVGIVVTAFQGFFMKNFQEPEKVAIRRSRVTALLRTLIHAVPLGVAIFEIALNSKGQWVGKNFDKQNYLQFAAKAHEVAIQASISTILLSYIRFQISKGKGIPFGAVLGGLQFLQVSYLWSTELWSSVFSKEFQLRKKICFVSLILVCIIIATTAGPSSANLLIARHGLWSTDSQYLAVNTTFQNIWPDRLDGNAMDRDCMMVKFDALHGVTRCPLSDMYFYMDTDFKTALVNPGSKINVVVAIQSPGTSGSRFLEAAQCFTFNKQICATIPQAAIVRGFIQSIVQRSHRPDGFGNTNRLEAYQTLQKNYYQPYTVTSCVFDVVKDKSDETPLRFPRILQTVSDLKKHRDVVSIPGLTKGQMIENSSGDHSNFSVHWIDLPQNNFSTGIPGVVIVNPQSPNGPPYNIYQCTSDAGWGSSVMMTNSGHSESVFSHRTNNPPFPKGTETPDSYGYIWPSYADFTNMSNLPFPERRISVSQNWMKFLNPTLVLADNSNVTFISRYLSLTTTQLKEKHVARMLATLISVALSNTEVEIGILVSNDSNTAYAECKTCLVFEIENSVFGWLYTASETTTKLAIAVMLAYCVLVLSHIIYSAISGVSSTAWDSTAELVALAMNSSPTEILQNTCAGIIGVKALKTPVRVLATSQGHLELVFGEFKDPNAQVSTLVINEKYGKLACEDNKNGGELESMWPRKLQKRAVDQGSE